MTRIHFACLCCVIAAVAPAAAQPLKWRPAAPVARLGAPVAADAPAEPARPVYRGKSDDGSRSRSSRFGEPVNDTFNNWNNQFNEWTQQGGRNKFQSDHAFDIFASPVTNPSLFEDPRALTELRPIFTYQTIPGSNPVFQGGNAFTYGTQARLALTDKWSVTLNKLGGASVNPGEFAPEQGGSGFQEIHVGPKWTFYRRPESNTALAAGAIFQIPTGSGSVYQDTGSLSIVPYLSGGFNLFRTSYGSFNFMNSLGYSLSIDNARSDFFYNSLHVDFDVGNAHKFYPLVELNWFHYTKSGNTRNFGQEGRDFGNFGSSGVSGRDYLSLAAGARYKFTERFQVGAAVEFPISSPRDFQDVRFTIDTIFRY